MFITYKIYQQLSITPQQYSNSLSKAIKQKLLQKYLYKICFNGICLKINKIQLIDNVILRKDADILVILHAELILMKFVQDEYFEGEVVEFDAKGIIVKFMNGLLEGRILPTYLHQKTIYNYAEQKILPQLQNQQSNQKNKQDPQKEIQNTQNQKQKQIQGKWILPIDNKKAFTWKINDKVRFKIQSTNWQKENKQRFADIILLRADEEGLGPISWWI